MLYKELKDEQIILKPNQNLELDLDSPCIIAPIKGNKIFLNWFNDKGKLWNTLTLTKSTIIKDKIRIINSNSEDALILKIPLPAQND